MRKHGRRGTGSPGACSQGVDSVGADPHVTPQGGGSRDERHGSGRGGRQRARCSTDRAPISGRRPGALGGAEHVDLGIQTPPPGRREPGRGQVRGGGVVEPPVTEPQCAAAPSKAWASSRVPQRWLVGRWPPRRTQAQAASTVCTCTRSWGTRGLGGATSHDQAGGRRRATRGARSQPTDTVHVGVVSE